MSLAVAKRLVTESPSNCIVGRGRDHEFIVILSEPENASQVDEAARHLLNAFKVPFSISGQDIFVTLAIGISSFPANSDGAETPH